MPWTAKIHTPQPGHKLKVTVTVDEDGYVMDEPAVLDEEQRFVLLFYKEDPNAKAGSDEWTLESTAQEDGDDHLVSAIVLAGREIKAQNRRMVNNGFR